MGETGSSSGGEGQRGAFLILVAVFMIVVLAFLGVVFMTSFTTSTFSALNELQSTQALFIAEGGGEFHQRDLALDLDWYRSPTDPLLTTSNKALGGGSFTAATTLPATMLKAKVRLASTNPLRVYSVARFPTAGCVGIDDEFITYTNVELGSPAICSGPPPCFTGITRGAGACYGGGTAGDHDRGRPVYPVSTLGTNMPADCNDMASLTVTAHSKFLTAGTLDIEGEEVSYAGSSDPGSTLTGIQRCLGTTINVAHAIGQPVTPLLDTGDSASYQAEVTSVGTQDAAVRTVRKTLQR